MKKMIALLLGLVVLTAFGAAGAESEPVPVPDFSSVLNIREIATEEEAIEYAKEFWAMDYVKEDLTDAEFTVNPPEDGNYWMVSVKLPGDKYLDLAFLKDGSIIYLENIGSGWNDGAGEEAADEGAAEEASDEEDEDPFVAMREDLDRKLEYPFLAEVNPAIFETYTELYPIDEGNNEFLTHYYETLVSENGEFDVNYSESFLYENAYRIKIVVQIKPVVRIVFFDALGDPEEGGNG